jgi:hypothetical protein
MSHQKPKTKKASKTVAPVHEFRPLPDRTPVEQVKALTQIVHQMSQTNFEIRLELNDLREQRVALEAELMYLRSITDREAQDNWKDLHSNTLN